MPPTCTRMGLLSWSRICRSTARAERMGPIRAGLWHWNTAAKRVMPPSTGSSKTMSAWSRPGLGPGVGVVVDLHGQSRALRDCAARRGRAR